MRDQRIIVYQHPNPHMKSFITNTEISTYRVEHFKRPLGENAQDALSKLGPIGSHVVKDIMKIHGVEEIYIKPKEIRMKKDVISSWQEIEKGVFEILNAALRRKEMRLIKG
jgi:hypothetical protein